ncbi:N-acetyl-gamma-glutamyl-phosphate reductase [Succinivibrio dextrinosolvens]|uniref:N-acetyl-gamma-glutamyl-phosphate reductase n=1 Tax=Succinivibrio dextrinosolvens TaxID=83771 RepID=A0A662ZBD9_9GAMM|nr:N-acetyl-gamma-glutamyl-phosphate reductase [Succinivibrio dextrinosolvens]SFK19026.1 N-acetyl-gamma-glutamyl-phosphate reductase [Succinivibrio dextrinosolvens]
MLSVAVVGASGYAGAELCRIFSAHNEVCLKHLYVSENSLDKNKKISDLYGSLRGRCDLVLEPMSDPKSLIGEVDAVFLATDHKVSHDVAPVLTASGIAVFDLSGAFRISDLNVFAEAYGFEHEYPELLASAVYALPEFVDLKALRATKMISLPGCYPTASQLALRPLIDSGLLDLNYRPSINAVSGVSGAGRKAKLTNSFCEVSLNAYGVFTHRHQPEIAEHLGTEVIFTPHLGDFKRGIHATINAKLKDNVTAEQVKKAFAVYDNKPLVRVKEGMPKLMDVQYLPYCDIGYAMKDGYIVVCSCIDNLLKGASAQAVQVFNLYYGFDELKGLFG